MGFCLFVLPETRSGGLSSIVSRVRGTVVSWANWPVGVPFCLSRPAPPSCRAPPRPDPPVVYPGFGFDKCSCIRKNVHNSCSRCLLGTRDGCFLGEPMRRHLSRPAPSHPAAPPCASQTQHARGMSKFSGRQVNCFNHKLKNMCVIIPNLQPGITTQAKKKQNNCSSPKPGYTTGESGWGGAPRGSVEGRSQAGRSPTDRFAQETTDPPIPKASKTNVRNFCSEAQTKEISGKQPCRIKNPDTS